MRALGGGLAVKAEDPAGDEDEDEDGDEDGDEDEVLVEVEVGPKSKIEVG